MAEPRYQLARGRHSSSEITELLGTSPNEVAGHHLLDLVPEDDAEKLRDADHFVNAQSVAKAIRIRDANGEYRRLCCVLTALTTAGGRCSILLPEPDPGSIGDGLRVAQLEGAPSTNRRRSGGERSAAKRRDSSGSVARRTDRRVEHSAVGGSRAPLARKASRDDRQDDVHQSEHGAKPPLCHIRAIRCALSGRTAGTVAEPGLGFTAVGRPRPRLSSCRMRIGGSFLK